MPLAQAVYDATEANMLVASGKSTKTLAERIESDSPTFSELLKKMPVSEKYITAQSRKLADGRLEAKIGKVKWMTLADVIARCKKTGVISQYLLHYTGRKNGTGARCAC